MKRTGQNVVSRIPSISQISWLRRKIIDWFRKNKRSYPWRKTTDPFKILIAEMMLQRTKADQVRPVYNDFFSSFNMISILSTSREVRNPLKRIASKPFGAMSTT